MDEQTEYRLATGREPVERFPDDHPDRWQWDYSGTPAERERLADLAGLGTEADEVEALEQDALF